MYKKIVSVKHVKNQILLKGLEEEKRPKPYEEQLL